MNTDNGYLVILLVIGIVVLSNLAMFALVRGWRGNDSEWLTRMRGSANRSFNNDESLDELHKRVEALKKDDKEK